VEEVAQNIFIEQVERLGLTQPFDWFELDPHQLVGHYRSLKAKRIFWEVDKGLGKTLMAFSVFESPEVHKNIPGFTVLIFAPEKGMGAYIRDFKKFGFGDPAEKIQLLIGDKGTREKQWKNSHAKYFITTYAGFLSDIGARTSKHQEGLRPIVPQWVLNGSIDGVVDDECHRQFRRRGGKTFEVQSRLFRYTLYFIPMSGGLVTKHPAQLWPTLHLIDPKLWSSYWKYVNTWCEVQEAFTHEGKIIVGPRRDRVDQWRRAVGSQVFKVTKLMVGNSIVPKRREFLDVEVPKWQRKLHDSLLQDLMAETPDGDFIFASNRLSALYKIRLALICPKALHDEFGYGQGIEDIFDDAMESGINRYAVFTPFKAPLPHIASYLRNRGANVWCLQGGIGLVEQERRLSAWRNSLPTATDERPSIVLATIQYAESWEIPEAQNGYMLGYEYDGEQNKQAEDRLHRRSSPLPVNIWYARHADCYDENIVNSLVLSWQNRELMFGNWYDFKRQFKLKLK
jgi:hypothetical protein